MPAFRRARRVHPVSGVVRVQTSRNVQQDQPASCLGAQPKGQLEPTLVIEALRIMIFALEKSRLTSLLTPTTPLDNPFLRKCWRSRACFRQSSPFQEGYLLFYRGLRPKHMACQEARSLMRSAPYECASGPLAQAAGQDGIAFRCPWYT